MRVCVHLLLLVIAAATVYAHPTRLVRQVWSFPEDDVSTPSTLPGRPPAQPNRPTNQQFPQPTRQTRPSTRPTSTRPPSTQAPEDGTSTPASGIVFQIPNCDCPSPPQYNPVCGTNGVTYVNRQKLNCARQCGTNVEYERLGVCRTPRK